MSAAQATSNKAALTRFCDAVNTGDMELLSKAIDELAEPDAAVRTPLPIKRPGRKD